jgi:uncharacterized protein YqhQ
MEHKKLPNATAVLVLGILSICFCAAWGIPGIALGIIALVLFKKDKSLYESDPVSYEQSFKNSSAGKVCAIVGLSLSAVSFLFITIYFVILGTILGGVASTINEVSKHSRNHQYESQHYDKNSLSKEAEVLDSNYSEEIEGGEELNQDSLAIDYN